MVIREQKRMVKERASMINGRLRRNVLLISYKHDTLNRNHWGMQMLSSIKGRHVKEQVRSPYTAERVLIQNCSVYNEIRQLWDGRNRPSLLCVRFRELRGQSHDACAAAG